MKKIIALVLCVVTVVCLVSCTVSFTPAKQEADLSSINTLGDFFDLDLEDGSWSYNENYYVVLFENGNNTYRIAAKLSDDIYLELENIDFSEGDVDEQIERILYDVVVYAIEDMTKYIPTEEELNQYVGKTGKELLDDGFSTSGYMTAFGTQKFFMSKGIYDLDVYFNENVDIDPETFDTEEGIKNLTVKKVEFTGFSSYAGDAEYYDEIN